MKVLFSLTFLCCLCTLALPRLGSNPDAALGTWLIESKRAQIEIYKCGTQYCGKVVWMLEPNGKDGKPLKDAQNPNSKLRNRFVHNMQIMSGYTYDASANEWSGGTIYDVESGKTYTSYMKLQADGTLYFKGYVMGMRWLGRSNVWTKVK